MRLKSSENIAPRPNQRRVLRFFHIADSRKGDWRRKETPREFIMRKILWDFWLKICENSSKYHKKFFPRICMSSKKANRRIFRNAFAQDWKEVKKSRAMMNIFLFVAFSVKEGNFPRRKMVEGEKMMEGGWLMPRESNFQNGGMRIWALCALCCEENCFHDAGGGLEMFLWWKIN